MQDLKLNTDGDLAVEEYDLALVTDAARVRQQLQIRLRFFKKEWFLDMNFGVPWFQDILRKPYRKSLVDGILKAQIMAVQDVLSILKFESQFDPITRKFDLDFIVDTTFGPVDLTGEF
jgi:hypothetical protein